MEQSLFGSMLSPEAQQQALINQRANEFAKMGVAEQLGSMGYKAGASLGGGLAKAFGVDVTDPTINAATELRSLASQYDTTTSDGLLQMAIAIKDKNPDMALKIAQEAQKMRKTEAEITSKTSEKMTNEQRNAKAQTDATHSPGTPEWEAAYTKNLDKLLDKGINKDKSPTNRNYYKGNQIIYEAWDAKKNDWVEYGRAPRNIDGKPTDSMQNIIFQANRLKCDIGDPDCYKRAAEAANNLKRENRIDVDTYKTTNTKLNDDQKTARGNIEQIKTIDKGLKMLEGADGKPLIGSFSETRVGIDKIASLFGLSQATAASATEALQANNMALAGQLLASGMFGAGTGISDKDMATALKMGAADMNLTFNGMTQILNNLREKAIDKIDIYNNEVKGLGEEFWKKGYRTQNSYLVNLPEAAKGATSPKIKISKPLNEMTDTELNNL